MNLQIESRCLPIFMLCVTYLSLQCAYMLLFFSIQLCS